MRKGQALVHRRAERHLVDQAAIDARGRQNARRPAGHDQSAQDVRPVALHHHRLLGAVVDRIEREVAWASIPTESMHFSGPLPPVMSLRRATTFDSRSKSIVSAPPARAIVRRSGTRSIAMTRRAPSRIRRADRHLATGRSPRSPPCPPAGCRTGPPACQPSERCRRGRAASRRRGRAATLMWVARRRAPQVFGLAPGIAAGEMGVAEQARGGVAEGTSASLALRLVRSQTEKFALALVALAADDRERHDDPVADLERLVVPPDLDHLSPIVSWPMMSPDFMPGMNVVVEVQVRAADGAGGDLDDRVAGRPRSSDRERCRTGYPRCRARRGPSCQSVSEARAAEAGIGGPRTGRPRSGYILPTGKRDARTTDQGWARSVEPGSEI